MKENQNYICYLHDLPMEEAVREWDRLDKKGTDLAAIRSLILTDLFYLMVKCCKRTDMLHPWVYDRCRMIEKQPYGCLDLWSREHFKSSLITFGATVQEILRDPEITVGIFSHNATIAGAFLLQIKQELENNTTLKKAFPDILYDDPQHQASVWNTESICVKRQSNPKEQTVEAWGLVGQQPTSKHYQLLVYDDIVTDKSVTTPEQIENTTKAFQDSLALGKDGGQRKIVGTRWSWADTYQDILNRGTAKARIYPATNNGRPDGKPVLFSEEYWKDKLVSSKSSVLACQYLLDPLSGEERVFDISTLEYWEVRPYNLNIYILVDPASSKKKDACNTAMVVVGVAGKMRKYLLDGYIHKMGLAERYSRLKELYAKWSHEAGVKSVKIGYETYGLGLVDMDYIEDEMRKEGIRLPIEPLTSSLNGETRKRDRIERIQPDLRNHNILFPYPTQRHANEWRYTSLQSKYVEMQNEHLVSKPLRRKDSLKNIYDVAEVLKSELQYFPHGGSPDGLDAFSRIYDLNYRDPNAKAGVRAVDPRKL